MEEIVIVRGICSFTKKSSKKAIFKKKGLMRGENNDGSFEGGKATSKLREGPSQR